MERCMIDQSSVRGVATRYCATCYPDAEMVFLCGSWARGTAHEQSDIDLVVLSPTANGLFFEGVSFESWLIEVCVLSIDSLPRLFSSARKNRTAPVLHQLLDALLLVGDDDTGQRVKRMARDALAEGPKPLTVEEMADLRWSLTALLLDLQHGQPEVIPALAAQCYVTFARAALDAAGAWQGERKALRRALVQTAPEIVERLDRGLRDACAGDVSCMRAVGSEILESLGGQLRTYAERYWAAQPLTLDDVENSLTQNPNAGQ
jgi:predicted nucleotidyltransferase